MINAVNVEVLLDSGSVITSIFHNLEEEHQGKASGVKLTSPAVWWAGTRSAFGQKPIIMTSTVPHALNAGHSLGWGNF